jgi:hypothetical protein
MRLRWSCSNDIRRITDAVGYGIYAHKLSPEKRFYYERFKMLLQAINDIKIDNFGKNDFL